MPDSYKISPAGGQVDEIKNRLDLVELVRGYMKLEKSGVNFRGLCPFHHEKTPSFFVSPSRQLWRCFGCSMGGDMFTFIQEIEGVDFKDALSNLADKAGVRLRSFDPKVRSEKARLFEICEKSCQFFEKQLMSSTLGREALEYLLERGISETSVKKFRVGFAPNARNALCVFLREQGYSPLEVFKAGVSISSQGGEGTTRQQSASYYDRFRGRIMFPIFDLNGQIIGFGGRVFFAKNQVTDAKLAKYINTPQTLLYDKSRTLYGLDRAKMKIREQDSCMLVEGYTDVIMAHQAGTENVAAVSGTALTEQQLDIVRRYTENLTILFDMDIAGDNATKRGIDLAQKRGFNIRIVTLPEGKDPAEIIQKNKRGWDKAIGAPLSIGDFYFQTAFSKIDGKGPEGMRNISKIILPMIKRIPSQIEQSYWVQKLASEFGCAEDVVWQDLESVKLEEDDLGRAGNSTPVFPERPKERTRSDKLYERLLLIGMKNAIRLDALSKKDIGLFDKKSPIAAIFLKIYNQKGDGGEPDLQTKLSDEEKEYLSSLLFQEEVFPTFSADVDLESEFEMCLNSLRRIFLQDKLLALQREMKGGRQDAKILEKFKKATMELAKL